MNSNLRLGRANGRPRASTSRTPRAKGSRKPKVIAGLLLAGIVIVGGGSVYAATRPTWTPPATAMSSTRQHPMMMKRASATTVAPIRRTHSSTVAARPKAQGTRVTPKADSHPATVPGSKASITYTVKSGDTLSGIAEWFKLHGYGGLYRANMAVIGADPNLIFPGQRITISHGKMSMGRPAPTESAGA